MSTSRKVRADLLVGVAEIAARANVTRQPIANWRSRWSDFPQPLTVLSCGPVYDWSEIEQWLRIEHQQVVGPYTRNGRPVAGRTCTLAARI